MARRAAAFVAGNTAQGCVRIVRPTIRQIGLADERTTQAETGNSVFTSKALHYLWAAVAAGENDRGNFTMIS